MRFEDHCTESFFLFGDSFDLVHQWLDDFAGPATQAAGEIVIQKELAEIQAQNPKGHDIFMQYYKRTADGERDLYF